MSKRQKVVASAGLFICLIGAAWYADEQMESHEPQRSEGGVQTQSVEEKERDRPFAPREYIRVRPRDEENSID